MRKEEADKLIITGTSVMCAISKVVDLNPVKV